MDRKSQKLTNILLFIITCIFVLGFLCAIGKGIFAHRSFGWEGCMKGQYKNIEKWDIKEWERCGFWEDRNDIDEDWDID